MDTSETIKQQIAENTMILYMKGSPSEPMCGFSAQAVRLIDACGHPYAYVNILEHPDIRATLPKMMNWPTFPQLYIDGELIGGCDIITELFEKGELKTMIDEAFA